MDAQPLAGRIAGSAGVPPAWPPSARGWHSRGYLPHLHHPGLVQMVTFRLADALPATVLAQLAAWPRPATLPYSAGSAGVPPARTDITMAQTAGRRKQIEKLLDSGHGACHLRDPYVAALVEAAILYFDGSRYRALAWVVMPNHVHVVVETIPPHALSVLEQSWKSFTAKATNRHLGRTGTFWQREYFDRAIRDEVQSTGATAGGTPALPADRSRSVTWST